VGEPLLLLGESETQEDDGRRKCLELGADKVFDKSNEIDALIGYCQRLASGEAANSSSGSL
jgi:hypothetical protein